MFSDANCYSVFLAMHYTPETSLAFFSVEHIMRDVNYGIYYVICTLMEHLCFLLQFMFIFLKHYFMFICISKAFSLNNWCCNFIINDFNCIYGYVLPWGQMSFWAATVITNFVTAVPVVGLDIVYWIWGGFLSEILLLTDYLAYIICFLLLF